jgi:hypothetical protein
MTTLHYGPLEAEIEWPEERYVLDVAYEHAQAKHPDVAITDLVMHPDLADVGAGGCARVRAWCVEHGIRPVLTTWAPPREFYLGNIDYPPRIDEATDALHVPWITPFDPDRFQQ